MWIKLILVYATGKGTHFEDYIYPLDRAGVGPILEWARCGGFLFFCSLCTRTSSCTLINFILGPVKDSSSTLSLKNSWKIIILRLDPKIESWSIVWESNPPIKGTNHLVVESREFMRNYYFAPWPKNRILINCVGIKSTNQRDQPFSRWVLRIHEKLLFCGLTQKSNLDQLCENQTHQSKDQSFKSGPWRGGVVLSLRSGIELSNLVKEDCWMDG